MQQRPAKRANTIYIPFHFTNAYGLVHARLGS